MPQTNVMGQVGMQTQWESQQLSSPSGDANTVGKSAVEQPQYPPLLFILRQTSGDASMVGKSAVEKPRHPCLVFILRDECGDHNV